MTLYVLSTKFKINFYYVCFARIIIRGLRYSIIIIFIQDILSCPKAGVHVNREVPLSTVCIHNLFLHLSKSLQSRVGGAADALLSGKMIIILLYSEMIIICLQVLRNHNHVSIILCACY